MHPLRAGRRMRPWAVTMAARWCYTRTALPVMPASLSVMSASRPVMTAAFLVMPAFRAGIHDLSLH